MIDHGITNFLRLYMHCAGESEVPRDFHLWCAFSLLGAAVGDNVWIEKFKGKKLIPNLMVFLLGQSGCGKGEAIGAAMRLVSGIDAIKTYEGGGSIQGLIKRMSKRVESRLYLVTEELAMDVGVGAQAQSFVKHVTGLVTRNMTKYERETLSDGHVELPGVPCLNWLAGSTRQWLVEAVDRAAMQSGFGGRMLPIERGFNPELRIVNPRYPGDYQRVWAYLRDRIEELTYLSGEFRKTVRAREVEEAWYLGRPAPTDEALLPAWKREHDLMLKLAMLLSLADGISLEITDSHMAQAQRYVVLGQQSMPDILRYSEQTPATQGVDVVRRGVEKHSLIQRSVLMRTVSSRGIDRKRLDEILSTLTTEGVVKIVPAPLGHAGVFYAWHTWKG